MEYLRQEFGKTKKQKLAPESVQEKLAKACRRSLSMPKGMNKDRCNFHPSNMRNLLRASVANRASMEAQLRTRDLQPTAARGGLGVFVRPGSCLRNRCIDITAIFWKPTGG